MPRKLAEIVVDLEKADFTKPDAVKALIGELKGAGELLVTELSGAQTRVTELTTEVGKLKPDAENAKALKTLVDGYVARDADAVLESQLVTLGKEHKFNPTAVKTALKIIDRSKLQIDTTKKAVAGLDKEFFGALQAEHPTLFESGDTQQPTQPALNAPAPAASDSGTLSAPRVPFSW